MDRRLPFRLSMQSELDALAREKNPLGPVGWKRWIPVVGIGLEWLSEKRTGQSIFPLFSDSDERPVVSKKALRIAEVWGCYQTTVTLATVLLGLPAAMVYLDSTSSNYEQ